MRHAMRLSFRAVKVLTIALSPRRNVNRSCPGWRRCLCERVANMIRG